MKLLIRLPIGLLFHLVLCSVSLGCKTARETAHSAAPAAASTADTRATTNAAPFSVGQTNQLSKPDKFQKWNPVWWFGNVDDPVPPDWYRAGEKHRKGKWYCRNSLHNFTFYVIGIADKKFERAGCWPREIYNPHDGWNWAVCKYKWLRLPFISYKKRGFMFYCGWRERGNWGMKLKF